MYAIFVHPDSGGGAGSKLIHTFESCMMSNTFVFDLNEDKGPQKGLRILHEFAQSLDDHDLELRVFSMGGDGTAGWIMTEIDNLAQEVGVDLYVRPKVAVFPLGTGNDLARVLGWGSSYNSILNPLKLQDLVGMLQKAKPVALDRWQVDIFNIPMKDQNEIMDKGQCNAKTPPLESASFIMNNYASIGLSACIALQFHEERNSASPGKFRSKLLNEAKYGQIGLEMAASDKYTNLRNVIMIEIDGKTFSTDNIPLKTEDLTIVNIPSFGGGSNLWGNRPDTIRGLESTFNKSQLMDDGKIELVAVASSVEMAQIKLGIRAGFRLAQGKDMKIYTKAPLPFQVDGEPCDLASMRCIHIHLKNQAIMLQESDFAGEIDRNAFSQLSDDVFHLFNP